MLGLREISVSKKIYAENARHIGHMFTSALDQFGPMIDIYNMKTVILAFCKHTYGERGKITANSQMTLQDPPPPPPPILKRHEPHVKH